MQTPRLNKLITAWLATQPVVAGNCYVLCAVHDDDCPYFLGKGDCACDPTFRWGAPPPGTAVRYRLDTFDAPPASSN